jgi:hypothetical protein
VEAVKVKDQMAQPREAIRTFTPPRPGTQPGQGGMRSNGRPKRQRLHTLTRNIYVFWGGLRILVGGFSQLGLVLGNKVRRVMESSGMSSASAEPSTRDESLTFLCPAPATVPDVAGGATAPPAGARGAISLGSPRTLRAPQRTPSPVPGGLERPWLPERRPGRPPGR